MTFLEKVNTGDGPNLSLPMILTMGGIIAGLFVGYKFPNEKLWISTLIIGSIVLFHIYFFLIAYIRAIISIRTGKRPIWREKSPLVVGIGIMYTALFLLVCGN